MFDKLTNLLQTDSNHEYLSDLKNPFKQDKIDYITIFIQPKTMFGGPKKNPFLAHVYFINDQTKGEQSMEAETFEALMQKLNQFIKDL